MNDPSIPELDPETEQALNDFVMKCPELGQLEALLSRFNIFRVLKADKHEIRHSNMLAWLFDPDESHGLDDRFLRRWLMQVAYEARGELASRLELPSPIEVDALGIEYVDVMREGDNIDLLVVVHRTKGLPWVICIENKVESTQHSDQLQRYRGFVEGRYAQAEHRFFVLLSKYGEKPEDSGFLISTYEGIKTVLKGCLEERNDSIGTEPRLLLANYLTLLEDDFVGDNEAAKLARKIYQSHKKAIDFIFTYLDDPISVGSTVLAEALAAHAEELGIVMSVQGKGLVRFLPKEWIVPQNSGGTAFGPNSPIVLCEVSLWTKTPELHITLAKAPDDWADKVWARAAEPPFKQEWKKRPLQFVKPYKARSQIGKQDLTEAEPEDVKARLFGWIQGELKKPQFKEAVTVIRTMLQELPAA